MTTPLKNQITMPPLGRDGVMARADLATLIGELNQARAALDPSDYLGVVKLVSALRVAVERVLPELGYAEASALGSLLRPITDLIYAQEVETYPYPKEKKK